MTTLADLTPRQREAVLLAAEGLGTAAIAARMGVHRSTTMNYLTDAYATYGIRQEDGYFPRVRLTRLVLEEQMIEMLREGTR